MARTRCVGGAIDSPGDPDAGGILGGVSRIQRHDDGLEVEVDPGREEFAARVVAEREALVAKALHLLSLYLHHDRRGFGLDTITVPSGREAELSFSWASAEAPEAESCTRFDVFFSADLHAVGFAVRLR